MPELSYAPKDEEVGKGKYHHQRERQPLHYYCYALFPNLSGVCRALFTVLSDLNDVLVSVLGGLTDALFSVLNRV